MRPEEIHTVGSRSPCCSGCTMTLSKTHNIKLISAGLLLRFDPRLHRFCSIIQSVTDVLSDLIYKLFSQRCYIKNIGTGPSRGQFSQTVSLPFVKAQISNIKHNPSVVPQLGSSHDPLKKKWNLHNSAHMQTVALT